MSLEQYLVDVLGVRKVFLDQAFLNEQEGKQQLNPQDLFDTSLAEFKTSAANTLFILIQQELSSTETTMIQKMSEALNWSQDHQQIFFPEIQDKAKLLLLIETSEQWLRQEPHRKLILFTDAFQTHPLLVPFFDIHHARICDLPRNISASMDLKKLTWDKIKILKKT